MSLFALASAAAVALGSIGLELGGTSFGAWVRTPLAYGVGLIMGIGLMAAGRTRSLALGAVVLTIVALAATLLSPAQSGVHRWIDFGGLHLNVAALLLPLAIVALVDIALAVPILLALIAAIAALLAAQPDASQATAFAVAGAILLARRRNLSAGMRLIAMIGLAALAVLAWSRPDPLQPVPEVEGIFGMLAGQSVILAAAAGLALAATSLIPLRSRSLADSGAIPIGAPLTGYFVTVALMPFLGAFPVPLVGLGMSFPIGYWLGMAFLCARAPAPGR
ncbi:MAG: hypothetical protein ACJ8FE_00320 [Sphingomicrobium sp.]